MIEQLGAGVLCPPGSAAVLRKRVVELSTMDVSAHDAAIRQWLEQHERNVLAAHAFEIIEPPAAAVNRIVRGRSSFARRAIARDRESLLARQRRR